MTDTPALHQPVNPVRFVTAASLFDGHDASINIMRRILQAQGAEVIHLGHNRSVDDVARAIVQEDVQGVAISSYQGGHVEYFSYLLDRLREQGAGHVRIYGGGGGVIVPSEIDLLHERGVARIFSPQDGQRLGLAGMVNTMISDCDVALHATRTPDLDALLGGSERELAQIISLLEADAASPELLDQLAAAANRRAVPVLGITGTGGSGKSSLSDELLRRFRLDQSDKLRIAIIAIDPTRRRGGGALLGDRIRMNAIDSPQVFFRSLATRSGGSEVPASLTNVILAAKAWGADLVVVETPGIGQGDAAIVPYVDVPMYVMTPEFGADSQLEKIDMLDFAQVIAINKFERRGADDALRSVRRQFARNRELFHTDPAELPVFGTVAARFNDDGVTALYQYLRGLLADKGLVVHEGALAPVAGRTSSGVGVIVPPARQRYLAEVADTVRRYHAHTATQAGVLRRRQQLQATAQMLAAGGLEHGNVDQLIDTTAVEVDPAVAALVEASCGASPKPTPSSTTRCGMDCRVTPSCAFWRMPRGTSGSRPKPAWLSTTQPTDASEVSPYSVSRGAPSSSPAHAVRPMARFISGPLTVCTDSILDAMSSTIIGSQSPCAPSRPRGCRRSALPRHPTSGGSICPGAGIPSPSISPPSITATLRAISIPSASRVSTPSGPRPVQGTPQPTPICREASMSSGSGPPTMTASGTRKASRSR